MNESVCEPVELRSMQESVCESGEPGGMQESVCESEEEESEEEGAEHDDVKNFRREVIESIERGGDTDNLVLEINGSKHAWNITLSEVGMA